VLPADDGRYTAAERDLIRAHEREHVARKDPRAAALAALAQCLCWFNPLVHLAAHLMRLDQELACDEAVVRRRPAARALYARTLLKTQLAAQPLPFGCYWPARGPHPLEVRIALLKARAEAAPKVARGAPIVAPPVDAIRP
jgi:beta-lactamase regulating signal transducer with metallopeptidase domain